MTWGLPPPGPGRYLGAMPPDTLAERWQALKDDFALFDGWAARYEYLLDLGKELPQPPAGDSLTTDRCFVPGCASPVWLEAQVDAEGRLRVRAWAEGLAPKGLTALLVRLFDRVPAAEAAAWSLDPARELGLDRNLTPTRRETFAHLLARIKSALT